MVHLHDTTSNDGDKKFAEYVSNVLKNETMGEEVGERVFGKTSLGQRFVFVTNKATLLEFSIFSNFFVRLIVDEEHRDLELSRESDVHSSDVLSKHGFSTLEKAQKHVQQKYANLADGLFEKHVSHRIRICPSDVYNNPDLYLKPGDHIQRRLDAFFPFANHEGVYLGEKKVAHINTESSTATGITVLTEKRLADARVDSFETFGAAKEVRIIVHCIRRQSRDDICERAIRITEGKLLEEENYGKGKYNLLLQNCQHFASYCVLGIEWMSDKRQLFEKLVATLAVTGIAISLVYAVATRNDKIEDKDKQKSISASKSNRDQ